MKNKLTIEELRENLKTWRKSRNLEENSTSQAQFNCYLEETEELKDAIGDSVVTLINFSAMGGSTGFSERAINLLIQAASILDINFEECLGMAWNEIKGRVGLTLENGKFTKWANLNHVQRLQVIESGQFDDKSREFTEQHFWGNDGTDDYIQAHDQRIVMLRAKGAK